VRRRAQAVPPAVDWEKDFASTASASSRPCSARRRTPQIAAEAPMIVAAKEVRRQAAAPLVGSGRSQVPLCSLLSMPSLDRNASNQVSLAQSTKERQLQPSPTRAENSRAHGTIVLRSAPANSQATQAQPRSSRRAETAFSDSCLLDGRLPSAPNDFSCPDSGSALNESPSLTSRPTSQKGTLHDSMVGMPHRGRRAWESLLHPKGSVASEPSTPVVRSRDMNAYYKDQETLHSIKEGTCISSHGWDSFEEDLEAEQFAADLRNACRRSAATEKKSTPTPRMDLGTQFADKPSRVDALAVAGSLRHASASHLAPTQVVDQAHLELRQTAIAWGDDLDGASQPDVTPHRVQSRRSCKEFPAGRRVPSDRLHPEKHQRELVASQSRLESRHLAEDAGGLSLKRIVEDFEDECAREHSFHSCAQQSDLAPKLRDERFHHRNIEQDSHTTMLESSLIPKPKTIARRKVCRVRRSTRDESEATSGADDCLIDFGAQCAAMPKHSRSFSETKACHAVDSSETSNPEASSRGRRSTIGSMARRASCGENNEKPSRRTKANKMSHSAALPSGACADSIAIASNRAKFWLDNCEPQRSTKPGRGIAEDNSLPPRSRATTKRHNKIVGAKHQRARSEPSHREDTVSRTPVASKSFLRFPVDAGTDIVEYGTSASGSAVNSVDDHSCRKGDGNHVVEANYDYDCNAIDTADNAFEEVSSTANQLGDSRHDSGSLGTKLEEMAVAVARLDAALYVDACHVSVRSNSSQGHSQTCDDYSTKSGLDIAAAPRLESSLKECLERNINEIKIGQHGSHLIEREKLKLKEVAQVNLSKVEDDISYAFSSAACGTAKQIAHGGLRRTSAPSGTCSVSTAASMASEASGSELVSDDDTSVSGPLSSRRSRSSLVQQAGVLADFFALKQKEVGSSIGRVVRRRRFSKQASQRLAVAKEGQANSAPAEVAKDSQTPSAPAVASAKAIGQGKNDIAAEPHIRQPSVTSVNECALCGCLIEDEVQSCFCATCAARLEVLDGSPQKQQSSTPESKTHCQTKQHVATSPNEVSYCVLCNSQFICNADASSSVVCSRCLGQPSGSPKVGTITTAKTRNR